MHREFRDGGRWHERYPKKARDLAAKELVSEFESQYASGDLGAELKEHEPMRGGLGWVLFVGLGLATVGIVVAATRKASMPPQAPAA